MSNAREARRALLNLGAAERIGSAAAGTALLCRALARPSVGRVALALGGVWLLQRGLAGHCPLYAARGAAASPRDEAEGDAVHRASEDSFPASDPPSWTPVAGPAARY